jgi:hypothetical protein
MSLFRLQRGLGLLASIELSETSDFCLSFLGQQTRQSEWFKCREAQSVERIVFIRAETGGIITVVESRTRSNVISM